MKISEMKRLLSKSGCYLTKQGANHEEWYSPVTKRKFMIPRHNSQELPTGTEKQIKKQAGL